MVDGSKAFSSFSVDDTEVAKRFYGETLGLDVSDVEMPGDAPGLLALHVGGGRDTLIYSKGEDHVPATFTVLNFPVSDIDSAVDGLGARGIRFERYEGSGQDEKAIARANGGGPSIAWFEDPAGNVLSVLEVD